MIPPPPFLPSEDGKKKGEGGSGGGSGSGSGGGGSGGGSSGGGSGAGSSSGGGSAGGGGSGSSGGSSRPPAPQEDTASEAGTPQGEAQARDDGDEEGLLTHSEEELVRGWLGGTGTGLCTPGGRRATGKGGTSELVGHPVSFLLLPSQGFESWEEERE